MKMTKQNMRIDVVVTFFIAFSMIVYEVFLTRFFAVILDYSYVFLVISLATLGIGLGGYLAYQFFVRFHFLKNIVLGLYPLTILTIVFMMYLLPYQGVIFYSLLVLIPFLTAGFLLAGIVQSQHQKVNIIYFSDLLGAGLGAAGAILLMNQFNPMGTIGLITLILFVVFYLTSFLVMNHWTKVIHGVVLVALVFNVINPFMQSFEFKSYRTSPYTSFSDEPDADIIYTQWYAFSRTDVYDADDKDFLYITIDGGAVSPISKFSGDFDEVNYLRLTTSYLAFEGKPHRKALIIGVGGGQEVLTAQMTGFNKIEAVDINKGSFNAVKTLSAFSGNVFDQEGVKAIISDGRNYIRQTQNQYDLIYLSLVEKQSENGLGLALTENFIFTQEAIHEYMNKLTENGRLAFLLHDEKELGKILFAAKKYFQNLGLSRDQIKKHIAVIGTYQHFGYVVMGMDNTVITRPLIMINKKPFTEAEASNLYTSAQRIQQIPVHIPYVNDQWTPFNQFIQNQDINVEANRDDQPFFYHKTNGVPKPLIIGLIVSMVMALWIVGWNRSAFSSRQAIYFAGVAIGFMLIEVTLVQRLILPLGHPTLSFVVVLGVLLVAGGIGSYFSTWFTNRRQRYIPLLLVAITAVGVNVLVGWYDDSSFKLSQVGRVLWTGTILLPLGFFMGMPFPFGLSRVKKDQIAISWGVNGIMTVAGSLLAALLSLTFGFTITIMVGASIYALLYIFLPLLNV